jgi:hypothetical protein
MHARYYSGNLGRFLSVDPGASVNSLTPQTWNKYHYSLGNPLKFIDPDGALIVTPVRLPNFERNAKIRSSTKHFIEEKLPVCGKQVAALLDVLVMSQLPPESMEELVENANANLVAMATPMGPAARALGAKSLGTKGVTQIGRQIRGLQKQLDIHLKKLDDFRANPDKFDNKGFLRDAPSQEIRDQIIEGRIRSLEKQIDNFRRQIEQAGGGR